MADRKSKLDEGPQPSTPDGPRDDSQSPEPVNIKQLQGDPEDIPREANETPEQRLEREHREAAARKEQDR